MLYDKPIFQPSEFDRMVYEQVVPRDHRLRTVLKVIPWDQFRELLAPFYAQDVGRPTGYPVVMLKLEFLRYLHNLSDREVITRAETDLSFRFFLDIPLRGGLPDPSSLCVFRGRLGVAGFRKIFNHVVHLAREHGIVKDHLRLKDATHVIANAAVPTALALVAQTRDKLLTAAEPFAPLMVKGERVSLETLREVTQQQPPAARLVTRLSHLREILAWADTLTPPESAETNRPWQTLLIQRDLAHKILDDQEQASSGHRTLSITDPDARQGKHGEWFVGYLADFMIDAHSEIITAVNVLPGCIGEAFDAVKLIREEETAHGNDIEKLSIDGVGFNGPLLRELEDPNGLNLDTYVPVPPEHTDELFTPRDFPEDRERGVVTCPAGQTSKYRFRDNQKQTTKYQFDREVCGACPLLTRCMKRLPGKHGRTVCKSDYQVEHDRARGKVSTTEYSAIRHEHPKIERKLGEVMNRHGGRRARYRGTWKVLMQELMAATVTNVKRFVRLTCAPTTAMSSEA